MTTVYGEVLFHKNKVIANLLLVAEVIFLPLAFSLRWYIQQSMKKLQINLYFLWFDSWTVSQY